MGGRGGTIAHFQLAVQCKAQGLFSFWSLITFASCARLPNTHPLPKCRSQKYKSQITWRLTNKDPGRGRGLPGCPIAPFLGRCRQPCLRAGWKPAHWRTPTGCWFGKVSVLPILGSVRRIRSERPFRPKGSDIGEDRPKRSGPLWKKDQWPLWNCVAIGLNSCCCLFNIFTGAVPKASLSRLHPPPARSSSLPVPDAASHDVMAHFWRRKADFLFPFPRENPPYC